MSIYPLDTLHYWLRAAPKAGNSSPTSRLTGSWEGHCNGRGAASTRQVWASIATSVTAMTEIRGKLRECGPGHKWRCYSALLVGWQGFRNKSFCTEDILYTCPDGKHCECSEASTHGTWLTTSYVGKMGRRGADGDTCSPSYWHDGTKAGNMETLPLCTSFVHSLSLWLYPLLLPGKYHGQEPGRLQSMGSLRVRQDWVTSLSLFTLMHWRRKWQPTPVFLPGESQGRQSLVGCRLWGRTELDTTEAT